MYFNNNKTYNNMQRKPGYPVANNMKMEVGMGIDVTREGLCDEEEPQQRRQQLINFGHSQWGFNNWSWSVTSQDLDFAEPLNGKYTAGVACYVSVKVKSLDICRDNVGYATSIALNKGLAIHRARKCSVTNALRETLMSFGGNIAIELLELLESNKNDITNQIMAPEVLQECNQNPLNKSEPKNLAKPNIRRDPEVGVVNIPLVYPQKGPKNTSNPPVAKAHPMPANLPTNLATNAAINAPATPAANLPPAANATRPPFAGAPPVPVPAHVRPNSNEAEEVTSAAREERRRRQRQAKEEFLRKQMEQDVKQEISNNGSMELLMADIISPENMTEVSDSLLGKRKSPGSRDNRNVRSKPDTDKI